MNNFLFLVIGVLVVGAVAIGVFMVTQHATLPPTTLPVSDTTSPATTTSAVQSTPPPQTTSVQPSQAPGTFTLAQVALHNSSASCYTTINGVVYDVTSWIDKHKGGAQAILSLCGKDGSAAFNGQHGGQQRPEQQLASFKIGTLVQ